MWSIGIDVNQRSFAVCILDEHGEEKGEKKRCQRRKGVRKNCLAFPRRAE